MNFKVNDKVMIRQDIAGKWTGVVFTIEKFLTKNVELVASNGRKLRAQPHVLVAADSVIAEAPTYTPWEPPLSQGTVIKFRDELYVILAVNPSGRYRVVKLGGDPKGRYFTNVTRTSFTVVDVSSLNLT